MSYTVRILSVVPTVDAFDVSFEVLDGKNVLATHTQGFPAIPKEVVEGVEQVGGAWEWTSSEVVHEAITNFVRDIVERNAQGPPPVTAGDTFEV